MEVLVVDGHLVYLTTMQEAGVPVQVFGHEDMMVLMMALD